MTIDSCGADKTGQMAFGQPSGPPASGKDVQELLRLLQAAGHSDFRDARGPMGFNQRQAGGKFSRDEVAGFIEQLEHAAADAETTNDEPPPRAVVKASAPKRAAPAATGAVAAEVLSAMDQTLRRFPTDKLAAELQRRGWVVMEP